MILNDRQFYLLDARRLVCGVWDSRNKRFLGIMNSFGHKVLDYEHLYTNTYGSAKPISAIEYRLDSSIPLVSALPPVCRQCGDKVYPVWVDRTPPSTGTVCVGYGHYLNVECELEGAHMAVSRTNEELYNVCMKVEESLYI